MKRCQKVVVEALGETPSDARLALVEDAEVEAPGPGEVLLRVRASTVGWVDLLMAAGQYQHRVEPPYTPGLEFSGEVLATGPGVVGVRVGDDVLVDGLAAGPRSLGDHATRGGFSTHSRVPARALHPLPAGWTHEEGCGYLGSMGTAYHALVTRGRVRPGEVLIVHGATGATGLAAVQLGRHLGATVIATGRSSDKLRAVHRLGAHHTLATTEVSLRDAVRSLTGGRGADVVYDAVGGALTTQSLRCLRFGGRLLIVGWAATPFAGRRGERPPNQLPTNLVLMKSVDVLGCPAAISAHRDEALWARRTAALLELAEVEALRPHVGARFPLERYREAWDAKWRSETVGSCVLVP